MSRFSIFIASRVVKLMQREAFIDARVAQVFAYYKKSVCCTAQSWNVI